MEWLWIRESRDRFLLETVFKICELEKTGDLDPGRMVFRRQTTCVLCPEICQVKLHKSSWCQCKRKKRKNWKVQNETRRVILQKLFFVRNHVAFCIDASRHTRVGDLFCPSSRFLTVFLVQIQKMRRHADARNFARVLLVYVCVFRFAARQSVTRFCSLFPSPTVHTSLSRKKTVKFEFVEFRASFFRDRYFLNFEPILCFPFLDAAQTMTTRFREFYCVSFFEILQKIKSKTAFIRRTRAISFVWLGFFGHLLLISRYSPNWYLIVL